MDSKRVLVVDDDTSIRSVIQAALEDEGYDVQVTGDDRAVTLARQSHPDLILLDLNMPLINGREIRRRLLADRRTADVPVVLISAQDRLSQVAQEMHAHAYLRKPFDLDNLIDVVRRETEME